MKIILGYSTIEELKKGYKIVLVSVFACMIVTLPIFLVPYFMVYKALRNIDTGSLSTSLLEFKRDLQKGMLAFGIISGVNFVVLSMVLIAVFIMILCLIDSTKGLELSETLQG